MKTNKCLFINKLRISMNINIINKKRNRWKIQRSIWKWHTMENCLR